MYLEGFSWGGNGATQHDFPGEIFLWSPILLLVLIGVGNATVDVSICGVIVAKESFHLGKIDKISEVHLPHLKSYIIQLYDLVEDLKVPNGYLL